MRPVIRLSLLDVLYEEPYVSISDVQNCVCYMRLGTDGYRTLFDPSRTDMKFLYGREIS